MPDDARPKREAQPDAHRHDDVQPSIETVIASLPSRSKKDREALLQALMDGDALKPEMPPVSGTTIQKSSVSSKLVRTAILPIADSGSRTVAARFSFAVSKHAACRFSEFRSASWVRVA